MSLSNRIALFYMFGACLLLVHLAAVNAALTLRQVDRANGSINWGVEGLATYEYSGCVGCIRTFNFYCLLSSGSKFDLSWSKLNDNLAQSQSQSFISNGVSLSFENPTASYAGIYSCQRTINGVILEEVRLNITAANPAAQAVASEITAIEGETVTLKFYASGLPPPQPGNITWRHDEVSFSVGNFSSDSRSLTISNVQLSDAGEYKFIVSYRAGNFVTVVAAVTRLKVLVLPHIVSSPDNSTATEIIEWNTLQISCTTRGTVPYVIEWYKVNGTLPTGRYTIVNETLANNNTKSNLIISEARVADSGLYFCRAYSQSYSSNSTPGEVLVKSAIRFVFTPPGGANPYQLTSLLQYINTGSNFSIQCQGTGSLSWSGPNDITVSTLANMNPHQLTTTSGGNDNFQDINFSDYSLQSNGLYTCTSIDGAIGSVYITADNPAIYTNQTMLQVGLMTNASITVYTGGNPSPVSSDISWYFNGSPISTDSHYILTNDNTVLNIMAPSSSVTGVYEAKVSTSQGSASVLINVTYFDPPIITIDPPVDLYEIDIGNSTVFTCSATAHLNVSVHWEYTKSNVPANGITFNGDMLIVDKADPSQSGVYACVATDGLSVVRRNITLQVKYSPIAGVGQSPASTVPVLDKIITEGVIPPTFFCTGKGYPVPALHWEYNGGQLPDGVSQNMVSDGVQLSWSRSITFSDNGAYSCVAINSINTTKANLFIAVNATPTIYSIYPSQQTFLDSALSQDTVFNCPQGNCELVCVARGWPVPSLYWYDGEGTMVHSAYTIKTGGVVISTLQRQVDNSSQHYYCNASNVYGTAQKGVVLVATDMTPPVTPSLNITEATVINLRLRLLTSSCSIDSVQRSHEQLRDLLSYVVLSFCNSCQSLNDMLTINSGCGDSTLPNSSVYIVTLTSASNPALNQKVANSIAQWWTTGPLVILNGMAVIVDKSCELLASSNDNFQCQTPPTSTVTTPTPTASTTPATTITNAEIFWAILVAVIVALLILVILVLTTVLCLCIKSLRNKDRDAEIGAWTDSMSTLKTYRSGMSQQELIETSFNTTPNRHPYTHTPMFDNPEYSQNVLIRHVQRVSANLESSTPPMMGGNLRQLQTTPTEEIDSGSIVEEETRGRRSLGSDVVVSNTPIQEILYQETGSSSQENQENQYAQIRPNAVKEKVSLSLEIQQSLPDYQEPFTPPTGRRSTLPSPPHTNHTHQHHTLGGVSQRKRVGTQPLSRQQFGTSTPVLAATPMPYSIPVSSQTNINKVGQATPPAKQAMPVGSSKLIQAASISNVTPPIKKHLPPVKESYFSQQHWYSEGGDSDIVTPTIPASYEISPYAYTPSSQILSQNAPTTTNDKMMSSSQDWQSTSSSQSSLPPLTGGNVTTVVV